jgi:membrane protein DedA with SNARE-associated domain
MELIAFLIAKPVLVYLIIFFGVMVEGEGIILLSSIFAAQGHLSWFWIAAAAVLGTIIGDLFWFEMGKRLKGTKLGCWLDKRYERTGEWVNDWIVSRYHWYAIVSKFMYFTTRPTIFLAGWHGFDSKKFFKITIYATLIWAFIILAIGYGFGYTIGLLGFKHVLRRIEFIAIGIFVGLFVIEWGVRKLVRKKTAALRTPSLPEIK